MKPINFLLKAQGKHRLKTKCFSPQSFLQQVPGDTKLNQMAVGKRPHQLVKAWGNLWHFSVYVSDKRRKKPAPARCSRLMGRMQDWRPKFKSLTRMMQNATTSSDCLFAAPCRCESTDNTDTGSSSETLTAFDPHSH